MACNFPCQTLGGPRWTQRPGPPVTSATHTATPLTHHWPTVINRCQWRTTVCMCVRCVSPACWGLGSISEALSLNSVLMWPMRLSALSLLYTTQWSTSALLTPLPLQTLTFPYSLSKKPTPSRSFSLSQCWLALYCKLNNNVSVVLFLIYLSSQTCGEDMRHFFWQYACHLHSGASVLYENAVILQ